jgi:hypothetical protein
MEVAFMEKSIWKELKDMIAAFSQGFAGSTSGGC